MAKKRSDEITELGQLTPDPENRRKRTPRGAKMLKDALTAVGAARSIVIDENDVVLAGNGVVEAANSVGITKVQVVEADGQTIIAVRRRNLSDAQKRDLALFDNRAPELAVWVPEQLAADVEGGADLAPFFSDAEQRKLLNNAPEKTVVAEVQTGAVRDSFWIAIEGPLGAQAATLTRLKKALADVEGVTVELGTIPNEGWK